MHVGRVARAARRCRRRAARPPRRGAGRRSARTPATVLHAAPRRGGAARRPGSWPRRWPTLEAPLAGRDRPGLRPARPARAAADARPGARPDATTPTPSAALWARVHDGPPVDPGRHGDEAATQSRRPDARRASCAGAATAAAPSTRPRSARSWPRSRSRDPDGLDRRPRAWSTRPASTTAGSRVELLPTFVACPALEIIRGDGRRRAGRLGRPVEVAFTFAVPWTSERITRGRPAGAAPPAGIAPPAEPGRRPLPVSATRRDVAMDSAFGPTRADRSSTAGPAASRSKRSSRSEPGAVAGIAIVGVVGAGAMGPGIAQVALEAGHEVVLHDVDAAAVDRGRDRIRDGLARRARDGRARPGSRRRWVDGRLDRLRRHRRARAARRRGRPRHRGGARGARAQADDLPGARRRRRPPRRSWRRTRAPCRSPRSPRPRRGPERVLGLHFFNPAPVMALVEVVPGRRPTPRSSDRAVGARRRPGARRRSAAPTRRASSSTGSTGRSRSRRCACSRRARRRSRRSTSAIRGGRLPDRARSS